jgi:beta-lysine N6-acetyltransferase
MRVSDVMEKVGGSLVQHGPDNDRVYLMKLDSAETERVLDRIGRLVEVGGYSKVFAKVPDSAAPVFLERGYVEEARVPGLFKGNEDGVFISRFYTPARAECTQPEVFPLLESIRLKEPLAQLKPLPEGIRLRAAEEVDLPEMAEIYRQVFESYPFPIHDPDYLQATMASHVDYFVAESEGRLLGVSSAEKDAAQANVEMTDFAVLPAARGTGLALHLLERMEQAMGGQGIRTAFTIARACSPGMNSTFVRLGYAYGGSLINNTQICGRLETMHVWHKALCT